MCRHLAYLGPPRTLHELLYAPEFSLERQSYAPRMNGTCILNADGFGAGWYDPARDRPVRYRRSQPMWTDVSFADVAEVVRSGCAVAAVRSATVGFPVDESCAQPFTDSERLFSHNGRIEGFAGVEAKLRELAGDLAPIPDARAPVDSALIFALAAGRWRAGGTLAEGLAHAVEVTAALAPGRYNLLAADGRTLAATAWGDTLFVRRGEGAVIASEPYDDAPGWEEVPDRSLVTVDHLGVHVSPL
ncbi:ergothioneine biosynthesis protein EgtC [Actinoallomurus sp. NPDC050550]|uniref:ergothioneine biosynthesis protein EgtC n=1 Tax=Actinoallomurus sp. NPDC050550 TaxID=3154937 RepID=UPI00340334D9